MGGVSIRIVPSVFPLLSALYNGEPSAVGVTLCTMVNTGEGQYDNTKSLFAFMRSYCIRNLEQL